MNSIKSRINRNISGESVSDVILALEPSFTKEGDKIVEVKSK